MHRRRHHLRFSASVLIEVVVVVVVVIEVIVIVTEVIVMMGEGHHPLAEAVGERLVEEDHGARR